MSAESPACIPVNPAKDGDPLVEKSKHLNGSAELDQSGGNLHGATEGQDTDVNMEEGSSSKVSTQNSVHLGGQKEDTIQQIANEQENANSMASENGKSSSIAENAQEMQGVDSKDEGSCDTGKTETSTCSKEQSDEIFVDQSACPIVASNGAQETQNQKENSMSDLAQPDLPPLEGPDPSQNLEEPKENQNGDLAQDTLKELAETQDGHLPNAKLDTEMEEDPPKESTNENQGVCSNAELDGQEKIPGNEQDEPMERPNEKHPDEKQDKAAEIGGTEHHVPAVDGAHDSDEDRVKKRKDDVEDKYFVPAAKKKDKGKKKGKNKNKAQAHSSMSLPDDNNQAKSKPPPGPYRPPNLQQNEPKKQLGPYYPDKRKDYSQDDESSSTGAEEWKEKSPIKTPTNTRAVREGSQEHSQSSEEPYGCELPQEYPGQGGARNKTSPSQVRIKRNLSPAWQQNSPKPSADSYTKWQTPKNMDTLQSSSSDMRNATGDKHWPSEGSRGSQRERKSRRNDRELYVPKHRGESPHEEEQPITRRQSSPYNTQRSPYNTPRSHQSSSRDRSYQRSYSSHSSHEETPSHEKTQYPREEYCFVCRKRGHHYTSTSCEAALKEPNYEDIRTIKGKEDILSNFYDCKLSQNGLTFHSSENLYHYQKALLCGEVETGKKFAAFQTALDGKTLSKTLVDKLPQDWNTRRLDVMKEVLKIKFEQCPEFESELYRTSKQILAHTLPDKYWGTGLYTEDTVWVKPEYWPGQNMHGYLLMELRKEKGIGEQLNPINIFSLKSPGQRMDRSGPPPRHMATPTTPFPSTPTAPSGSHKRSHNTPDSWEDTEPTSGGPVRKKFKIQL